MGEPSMRWRPALDPAAARDALAAFAGSRLLVLAAAAIGAKLFAEGEAARSGHPALTEPFDGWPLGGLLDVLLAPLIRWDASWYLRIAEEGYTPGEGISGVQGRPSYFPLYPLLVRALGGFAGPGAGTVAATAISLVAFLGALYLLHRLVSLELGERAARASVALLAFSPFAYFFSAPYTESLFLLESVGAFYAARRRRWAAAGALAALASATRNVGVLLLLPLLVLYLYEDRRLADVVRRLAPARRPRPSILWLALSPLGLVAFSAYLRDAVGDWQAWRHAQAWFGRPETIDPVTGAVRGTEAVIDALTGDLARELQFPVVSQWLVLAFAFVALVGVFRRLPAAYGVYSLALIVPPLCAPYAVDQPLAGFPRFMLVSFPLFAWLGCICAEPRVRDRVVLAFAALLALLTAAFATWQPVG